MCKCAWIPIVLCVTLGCGDHASPPQDRPVADEVDTLPKETARRSDNCEEILDRAIAGFGGNPAREKLNKCKVTTRVLTAIPAAVREMGGDVVIVEEYYCFPGKWRRSIRRASEEKEFMLFVVNEDSHWGKTPGNKVRPFPLPPPNMRKPGMLTTLDNLVRLRESEQEIVVGPEETIAGQTLVPLTIMATGRPRGVTYFDRSTGLIVKDVKYGLPDVHSESSSATAAGETETKYSEYKSFEGVTLPTRMVTSQAGKPVFDATLLQLEFPSKMDPHLFDKPQDDQ